MQAWIPLELATADLPDQRLNRRLQLVLDRLSQHPDRSLPAACRGWTETQAAYRFFDNDRFTPDDLLRPHYDATVARARLFPVVLVPQDTTALDLTRPRERLGGPLDDSKHWGFHAHLALAVSPDHIVLGVVHSHVWARDPADFPKSQPARYQPIEDKESQRWLDGYRRACDLAAAAPDTQVICLADSEADIYELFAAWADHVGPRADWIVRACQDRRVVGAAHGKLWAAVEATPILGTRTVQVAYRPARSHDGRKRKQARAARTATATVQACRVVLRAPPRPDRELADLEVGAVLVREVAPPPGEDAVEWLLLTSLPVGTFEQAGAVADAYTARWACEEYFRVLKSGCTVEALQLEDEERFKKCLAVYEIVAWRVLWTLRLGRECPALPCGVAFDEAEWRALLAVQDGPGVAGMPSLGEMVHRVAELGGYLGRKGDGPPGPKAMWLGLQRLGDLTRGWLAAKTPRPEPPPSYAQR